MQSDFSTMFVGLVSRRGAIYSELLLVSSDLMALAVSILHEEFRRHRTADPGPMTSVELTLFDTPLGGGTIKLPLPLLLSTCIVLSVWTESAQMMTSDTDETNAKVKDLVDSLLQPVSMDSTLKPVKGLSAGKAPGAEMEALLVESVSFFFAAIKKGGLDY